MFATFCATSATASFMAYNFHELSPYVLIGNPLTLTIIEIFAVPGALPRDFALSARPRRFCVALCRALASTASCGPRAGSEAGPDRRSTFPPSRPGRLFFSASRCFLPCCGGPRSCARRRFRLPRSASLGAAAGPSFDMAVVPAGDAVAFRAADGRLAVIGRGKNAFSTEQWLRADADGRLASEALTKANCDKLGCVGHLASGRTIALDLDTQAFAEDCSRADIIVTPRFAPLGCAATIVIDREKLQANRRTHACVCQGRCCADATRPARPTRTVPGRPRQSAAGAAPCRS